MQVNQTSSKILSEKLRTNLLNGNNEEYLTAIAGERSAYFCFYISLLALSSHIALIEADIKDWKRERGILNGVIASAFF